VINFVSDFVAGRWFGGSKYIVYIKTGDKRFAGTDANVFIQMSGEKTMTKKKTLDDEKNNFERGQLDVFQVCFLFVKF
jgi:hypothetical protein